MQAEADTIISDTIDRRCPVDIVEFAAEAMWREAAGKDCLERWDQLPECQKQSWRDYITLVLPAACKRLQY